MLAFVSFWHIIIIGFFFPIFEPARANPYFWIQGAGCSSSGFVIVFPRQTAF